MLRSRSPLKFLIDLKLQMTVSHWRASLLAYLPPVLSTEARCGNFGLRPRVVTLRHQSDDWDGAVGGGDRRALGAIVLPHRTMPDAGKLTKEVPPDGSSGKRLSSLSDVPRIAYDWRRGGRHVR